METIKIPQVSIVKEILIEDRGQEITFHDDRIVFKSSGKWDVENEDTKVFERKFFDNTYVFDKRAAWNVEMYYWNETKQYVLDFASVKIIFGIKDEHPSESKKRCELLFNKIINWKYSL